MSRAVSATFSTLSTLSTDLVRVKDSFNPRTDLGDLTDLKRNLKEHGMLQPILVCPDADTGTYFVIAGHRRLAAWKELGIPEIQVAIRDDIGIDSIDALALAVAENSSDSRTSLSPIDEANAFRRLMDSYGGAGNETKVANATGYSSMHVKRTLKLLNVPDSVRQRLQRGEISKAAAIAIADVPSDVRDRVVGRVTSGTTESDIGRIVNEARKESRDASTSDGAGVPTVDGRPSRHNRPVGNAPGAWVTPRQVREVRKMIEDLGKRVLNARMDIEEAAEKNDAAEVAKHELVYTSFSFAMAALLWQTGGLEKIDPNTKEFKDILTDLDDRLKARIASGKVKSASAAAGSDDIDE